MAIWTRYSGTMSTNNGNIKYRTKVVLNSQNIANNTSNVTVSVEVWRSNTGYTTKGTGTAYLTIDGTNYSDSIVSTQLFTHNSYTQVVSRTVNITHGSNGAKSLGVSARIAHSQFSSNNQSYSTSLNTIPRASTLSAFSFGGHLKNGVANSIKYTVDRKSGSFRHQIQLRDGNTTIWTWDNQNTDGSNTIDLTAGNVNTLLNRIKTSTTKSFTLRVATRSGNSGSWIGSAVSRNATATVHADVKPTVGAVSLSQTGNSVSSHYLQGKSKVNAKFTRSAGYGASITSSSIQVRRVSGGADSQTISSNDGTTKNPVTLNGSYQARGTATDSRGRTNHTAWATFTVTAYSGPKITNFTAVRSSSTPTTVSISRATTHTVLGTSNNLTHTVQRRLGTGSWTNVNSNGSGTITASPFSGTSISTGNSVTQSYEFRHVVTDKFGESATATVTVSTQRVVLDIHKNEGVGIGKIHEKGVLDVDGEAYFRGNIEIEPRIGATRPGFRLISQDKNGHAYIEMYGSDNVRKAYMGIPNSTSTWLHVVNQLGGPVHLGGSDVLVNQDPIVNSGSNKNGNWVQFYDGTQICTGYTVILAKSGTGDHKFGTATLPKSFTNSQYQAIITPNAGGIANFGAYSTTDYTTSGFGVWVTRSSTANTHMNYICIGRWK